MHTFQEISLVFENYLKENLHFPSSPENLFQPCRDILASGGKRLRPALCLMGNELFGSFNQNTFEVAMAIELFHNFTLIHDDLMDNAPLRRGKATVHETHGISGAVLSGDVMNIYAYEHLNKISHPEKFDILSIFNKAAIEVCIGQQMDMDFETEENTTKEAYLQMITLKTSVLLGMSLEAGAILGGANQKERKILYQFGKNMGIAFQLQDDYLDAFGEEAQIGKLPGGDIRSNKKTYLNICSEELLNDDNRLLMQRYQNLENEEKVKNTIELYREIGVDEIAKQAVDEYIRFSFADLEELNKSDEELAPLKSLATLMMNRQH